MKSDRIQRIEKEFLARRLGVWFYDFKTQNEPWSPGLERILELGPRENRSLLQLFPELELLVHQGIRKNFTFLEIDLSLVDSSRDFSFSLEFKNQEIEGTLLPIRDRNATSKRSFTNILQSLARLPGSVVFTTDENGLYTFLDGPGLKYLGIVPEHWLGRSIFDFLIAHPGKLKDIQRVFRGEIIFDESRMGDQYFLDRLCPIYGPHGNFQGIVGIQVNVTDKVRAENELQKKTELLDNLFNSIPDNIYVLDHDFNVLQINRATQQQFSDIPIIGHRCFEAVHGRETPCSFCPVMETYRTGEPAVMEYFESAVNRHFELTCFPLRDTETGEIIGATELARDITDRKRIVESLRRNDAFLNDLLDNLTEAVYQIDTNFTVTRANKVAESMYPELGGLVGKKCFETSVHDQVCPDCAAEAMFREGKAIKRTFFEKNKEDDPGIWLELTAFPQYDSETERINGAICILHDVTPRVEMEGRLDEYRVKIQTMAERQIHELRMSEAKIRSILETSGAAISFADYQGKYSYVNEKFQKMLGYSEQDVLEKHAAFFLTDRGENYRNAMELIDQALRGDINQFRTTQELRTRDGRKIWGDISVSVIRGLRPEETQLISVIVDVTAERELVEQLNRAKIAAEDASQAKSQFLATMSHEIRTPLNGVIGISNLLLDTPLGPKQLEYTRLIRASGESLLFLINDILDFSKIEAGKFELEHTKFDLPRLVESVMGISASRADEKHLELVVTFGTNVPVSVYGDPGRLRQILINLIGNALKFTHEGGIRIHVDADVIVDAQAAIRFIVTDTGIGIPKDRIDHLFRRFQQIDASSSRLYGGTGLGLAICKKLVELMGGSIHVESDEGKGSTFWFSIPLDIADEPTGELDCRESPEPGCIAKRCESCPKHRETNCPRSGRMESLYSLISQWKETTILVAASNTIQKPALLEQLKFWKFRPKTTETISEALEIFRHAVDAGTPIRLGIVDTVLKDGFGEQLVREIQEDERLKQTDLICLNRLSEDPTAQIWLCPERLHFVSKPVYTSKLLDAIVRVFFGDTKTDKNAEHDENRTSNRTEADSLKILIAEDNRVNQIVILDILKNAGMECTLVGDGREACDQFRHKKFDVVLMDCQMPLMDGYEATGEIRRFESENNRTPTPIIALTANATSEDESKCLLAGMDAYCSKPVDPIKIVEMIRNRIF